MPNLNQIEHLMLMTCFTAEDPYDKVRNVEGLELESTIIEAFLKAGVGQVEASAGPVEYNNPWYFWKTSYALESPEDFNRFFLYDGKINNNKETLISEIYK